ncbi:uncharacterized protein [Typha angustifolia]|uniref:uncharacterized protein n=1 Tax=Typha angustifolia TaxID=59011 RepID=UPI003C3015D5
MNDFGERARSWTGDPTSSETSDRDASLKDFGTSSNAISFGFAATAILISMFLIMAIFEHLIRPRASFLSHENDDPEQGQPEAQSLEKIRCPATVESLFSSDVSVLMPGQRYPTYLAQPAPLPCSREGIHWPPHDHDFFDPQ